MWNTKDQAEIDERRAVTLSGLSAKELRRLSRLTGLGHAVLSNGTEPLLFFTYEELCSLCLMAARSHK